MTRKILARVVESGYIRVHRVGPSMALLEYPDGTVRFRHRCDRVGRGVIICAPALQTGPHGTGHNVTRKADGTLTVTPSIACPDCNAHGHVTDGQWRGV